MTDAALLAEATALYETTFGSTPAGSAFAPGRVNLLGEHTDYNGGYVLPMPLVLGTAVAIGTGGPAGQMTAISHAFDAPVTRNLDEAPKDHWTDYLIGSLKEVLGDQPADSGIQISVVANLPVGSGLSSSAALEVSLIRAASKVLGLDLSAIEIATRARSAENNYVGVPCGIMDQFSVSVGLPGSALFLDTRRLEHRASPLPDSHKFVVIHSGVGHKLSDHGYAQRVAECKSACAALGVEMLSDLSMDDLPRIAELPAPLDGRARHIVTENDRVLRAVSALAEGDTATFARLMIESHNSQRDDYSVSLPEIDDLVAGALELGADGARLTGGGFGGSIVAFVKEDSVPTFCTDLSARFPAAKVLAVT